MVPVWLRGHAGVLKWAAILFLGCGVFLAGAIWGSWRAHARLAGRIAMTAPADPCSTLPPPGEFSRQSAMILGSNELILYHPKTFCEMVGAMRPNLPVILLVDSEAERQRGLELLKEAGVSTENVCFIIMPLDTMWVRDYGPMFRKRAGGQVFVADLNYLPAAPTGEKRLKDDQSPALLAKVFGLPCVKVPLRLGGGNMLTNGDGLCVTTTAALQNNPELGGDVGRIGAILTKTLGFHQWLYLRPLAAENTEDADLMMAFTAPDAVVVGQLDAADDPANAEILDEAATMLSRIQTSRGPMKVHRVPMPPPYKGLWRSYTNVIFANGTLLVPSYSDVPPEMQRRAVETYARLLPNWKIQEISADTLVAKQGIFHCISRNISGFVPLDRLVALTKGSPSPPPHLTTQPGMYAPVAVDDANATAPLKTQE